MTFENGSLSQFFLCLISFILSDKVITIALRLLSWRDCSACYIRKWTQFMNITKFIFFSDWQLFWYGIEGWQNCLPRVYRRSSETACNSWWRSSYTHVLLNETTTTYSADRDDAFRRCIRRLRDYVGLYRTSSHSKPTRGRAVFLNFQN